MAGKQLHIIAESKQDSQACLHSGLLILFQELPYNNKA